MEELFLGEYICESLKKKDRLKQRHSANVRSQHLYLFAFYLIRQIYRSEDQPRYLLGHGVLLGFLFVATLGYFTSYLYYSGMNASRDKVQAQESVDKNDYDYVNPDEIKSGLLRVGHGAYQGKGDREMSFRYAL